MKAVIFLYMMLNGLTVESKQIFQLDYSRALLRLNMVKLMKLCSMKHTVLKVIKKVQK
jgi:hypothetical protein